MLLLAVRCVASFLELVQGGRQWTASSLMNSKSKVSQNQGDSVKKLSEELELQNVLIVSDEVDQNLFLAARNLHKVDVLEASWRRPCKPD